MMALVDDEKAAVSDAMIPVSSHASVHVPSAHTRENVSPAVEDVEPDLRRTNDDVGFCEFLLKSLDLPKVDLGPNECLDSGARLSSDDTGLLGHERRSRRRKDDERAFSSGLSGAAENRADEQDGDERLAGSGIRPYNASKSNAAPTRSALPAGEPHTAERPLTHFRRRPERLPQLGSSAESATPPS